MLKVHSRAWLLLGPDDVLLLEGYDIVELPSLQTVVKLDLGLFSGTVSAFLPSLIHPHSYLQQCRLTHCRFNVSLFGFVRGFLIEVDEE